jgi:NAD(P)-dependent dehydrogenase (short-subunit alcohol dehydrogenase family)
MNNKKVVIITGASRGIGRSTALKFAANNFNVTAVAIDQEELQSLREELETQDKPGILACTGDLANEEFLKQVIDDTVQKWGRIDVLINNAAWRTIETMRTISLPNWEKTIKICLTAPAFLAKYAAEVMEKQGTGGVIINISSIMSQRAGGTSPAYIACKGAIESLTYELAALYGPKNIRVVAVNPGNIKTSLSSDYTDDHGNNISDQLIDHVNDHTPLKRAGNSDEIANVSYWLSSDEASFITGTTILVDGGFSHNFNAYTMKKLQNPTEF